MKKKKTLTRSENMARIRSTETSIEITLRKALWNKGYRYRKNCKNIFGKPDICFIGKKIAIFCDSEFWHGKEYLEGSKMFKTNASFWEEKMKRNIARDKKVTETLQSNGWIVLRFWQNDIEKNLELCIQKVEKTLKR